jgi:hypothetical protein
VTREWKGPGHFELNGSKVGSTRDKIQNNEWVFVWFVNVGKEISRPGFVEMENWGLGYIDHCLSEG